ncbi:MAG TPA: aldo/keto reductase, partial [Candidatus Bathyarchaeia archaeon]|nr:aldo/keto reductase [Candidatus Bathyarchaeia archaeon]
GLAGICGAAAVPGILKAHSTLAAPSAPAAAVPQLPSRPLGKTGLVTPLISMGTAEAPTVEFIREGYDAGITFFFSATYYGHGNNERLVGQALKGLPRDSFVVGTAATAEGTNARGGTLPNDMKAAAYVKTAEDSLKRFGLDHVDMLFLPFAEKREFIIFDPVLEAMTELKKQGKIRFAGIATHGGCDVALKAAADAKVYDVVMTSYNFQIPNKPAMDEALSYAAKAGVGIFAFKTTSGGAGDKNRTQPFNSDAALKWVLQNPNISSIISGMTSLAEMRKNLEMIKDLKLSAQETQDLELAAARPELGLYCRQCRQCEPQCPAGLDIPALMRSYMYAYGYRNAAQARSTLDTVEMSGDPCGSCQACGVTCASGFNVRERVRDIARLKSVPPEFLKG